MSKIKSKYIIIGMKANIICTTLLVEKSPQALPLGAACIASAIKNHPLTKDFCTTSLIAFNPEEKIFTQNKNDPDFCANYIANSLLEKKPDFVLFSVFVWNRIILEKAADILKKHKVICLAGGPEVTAHPEVFTNFDKVISGAGEETIPVIINQLLVKYGFTSENDSPNSNNINNNSNDSVPFVFKVSPYLDGTLDPAEYGGALWELARGCPFKCSYCYESKGEKKVSMFPMERIKKELELFAKKNIPQVFVLDPTYNANKQRAIELLNLIAKTTPNTFYYFEARAEFIDRQMAKAFTKIPCSVQIGLQSANEQVLNLVHRPFNKKQFVKNIGFLNQEGVTFGFDLIYGLPSETLKGFKEGIDFAISLYPNNLEIFCLSVLPGTDLFDRAKELNLTYESEPPYHIIHTDKFSNADIIQAGKLAVACSVFYNNGRAVPWFNTICHNLKIRPNVFFEQFYKFLNDKFSNPQEACDCLKHSQIEQLQIEFITGLYKKNHLDKYLRAATDIIRFNGAISRKIDTGVSEKVQLFYPVQYIDSEYALDLQFFVANVKPKQNTFRT